MTLDNLYDMAAADQYTDEGRQQIQDARRTYKIGEKSEKTGMIKTANGWRKPANKGAAAGSTEAPKGWEETRMASGKLWDSPDGKQRIIERINPETKEKQYVLRPKDASDPTPDKTFKSLNEATKAAGSTESKEDKRSKVRTTINTGKTPSGDDIQLIQSKVTGDYHVMLNGKSTAGGFRNKDRALAEYNAHLKGEKAPSEEARERIDKHWSDNIARSEAAMKAEEAQKNKPAPEKTYTFTKAGHVYNVPASSPAEAVQKLKSRGVKGFKESDAFDDSTPRTPQPAPDYSNAKTPEMIQKLRDIDEAGTKKVDQALNYLKRGDNKKSSGSTAETTKEKKQKTTAPKLKGQKLNEVTTTMGDGSKKVYKITGGENNVANEFFKTHGQRFSFMSPDVNVDEYVKPIDNNSFELKLWNRGDTSKGLYGKIAPSNNNTDDRYIVTKTKDGWEMKHTYRGNYGGMGSFEKIYKFDNNQFSRDAAAPLTGDTKIKVKASK